MSSQPSLSQHAPPRRPLRRPVVQTALYLLFAVLVMTLGLFRMWDVFSLVPGGEAPPALMAIPLASCLPVLLKHRAPLAGLVMAVAFFVADLLTIGSIVTVIVLLELLHSYTVTLAGEGRRRLLSVVIAGVAMLTAAAYLISRDLQLTVLIGLQFGALLGFSYWYANSIAQSGELVELYRQRADDVSRLAELDRESAVRGERERMARELHDVVAGHVAAVAIRSEAALSGEAGANGGAERRALRAVRDASLAAHGELRSMISVLREDGARDSGDGFVPSRGRDSLEWLVEEANRSGLDASYRDELEGTVATATDHAIGRIVQESLVNAAKHSSGARVTVLLRGEADTVELEILSRGGSSLPRLALPGNGIGLDLLAERAHALGGSLVAQAEPDPAGPGAAGAWAVRAQLPRDGAA